MQTAIATVCLSGTLAEKIAAIAAAGFKGVEIFENDLLAYAGSPAEVRRMVEDHGLKVVTLQPFRDFEGMPEPYRSKAFARAERKFDLMHELGCDLLMICSNVSPNAEGGIERAAADFRELGERAAARGLRVAFEALSWGRHINDYRDAWEVVRRAGHPAVGLVLDSFHILARGTELAAIRSMPPERLFLVQMADAPKLAMDYLSWSRHHRCFPGQGELDIGGFMQALDATGFDGLLSLEIFNDRFRAGSARAVAIDGQRSIIVMLEALGTRKAEAQGTAAALPPRAVCSGVAFIEFAVDERSAPGFERTLAGLGFRRAGRHRTKAVTHWSQGGIHIVVNAETEGFAHAFNLTHGTAVCAVALKVDDAQAALDRAVALLDQPFIQPVGPGELAIPAIRDLGGGLIYFVDAKSGPDRLWEVDFEAVPDEPSADAGLIGVDHVSQSMHFEEMLSWLLFYTSLLDARKTPAQTVVDPGGVVQSQVVETPDGSLRLILNASQSRQTLSSRFLERTFGSGVQHVAFASRDILRTVARLKEQGVELLRIPDNYYDDLEARTDLRSDEVARLRERSILYDVDGASEYLQAYTRTIEGGFFFEIVERRDYQGFGAANAPIRLAAQAQAVEA